MDHFWNLAAGEVIGTELTDTHPTSQDVVTPKNITHSLDPSNRMPLDSDIRSGGGAIFLCVTCHDPHGTGSAPAADWGRSFAGANSTSPVDNVHMLRYDEPQVAGDLCHKCHNK
jgi:hypothetical protein